MTGSADGYTGGFTKECKTKDKGPRLPTCKRTGGMPEMLPSRPPRQIPCFLHGARKHACAHVTRVHTRASALMRVSAWHNTLDDSRHNWEDVTESGVSISIVPSRWCAVAATTNHVARLRQVAYYQLECFQCDLANSSDIIVKMQIFCLHLWLWCHMFVGN